MLKSGHKVTPSTKEETEEIKKYFPTFKDGFIKLSPGDWFLLPEFLKYADRIYDFKLRNTDVGIMTYPKCGTTWTQEIVWTMLNNPNFDHPNADAVIDARSPFIELDTILEGAKDFPHCKEKRAGVEDMFKGICPDLKVEDGIFIQIAETATDPRLLKTHLPFSLMPSDMLDTCKMIYVARNPKDVLFSYLHHHSVIPELIYEGDLDKFIDLFTKNELLGSPFWSINNEVWLKKDHPNLHWIFFENMKADPLSEIRRLNTFLGTNLSEDKLKEIVEYTSFANMKKRDPMFGKPKEKKTESDSAQKKETSFFRKGKSGGWKDSITPEQNAKLDEWIARENTLNIPFKY